MESEYPSEGGRSEFDFYNYDMAELARKKDELVASRDALVRRMWLDNKELELGERLSLAWAYIHVKKELEGIEDQVKRLSGTSY